MNKLKKIVKKLFGRHYFRLVVLLLFCNAKKKPPVLVYQMGKVGSKTVEASLKQLKIKTIHVHLLTKRGLNSGELIKRSRINNNIEYWRNIYLGNYIREKKQFLPWKIITLVRDPVARNISAFFENKDIWRKIRPVVPPEEGKIDLNDLKSEFFNYFDHDRPLIWFDIELKNIFNIDVFSEPFPRDLGYKIYKHEKIEVLLLKLEKINDCFDMAIQDFLHIETINLIQKNITKNKEYKILYYKFLESMKFPNNYLEAMYSSRYARHFYTDAEIKNFKEKWRNRD